MASINRKTSDFEPGELVVYRAKHDSKPQEGIVTSTNQYFVFVRYSGTTSAATRPQDLEKVCG